MAEYIAKTPRDKNDIKTVLGDAASSTFVPRLKLIRWNGEVEFGIEHDLAGVTGQKNFSIVGDKYTLDTNRLTLNFYPKTNSYEFELVLKQKPPTNTISLPISTKGLDFFYQPELTAKEIARGDKRPENVIGSYAAYHSSKSGDFTKRGGNNYGCGKAFHIYRPRLTDSIGATAWATLDINTTTKRLTITAPQDFLDSATYPVTIDPNFGYETEGASIGHFGANGMLGSVFASAAGTNVADSISAWILSDSQASNVKGVIVLSSTEVIVTNGVGSAVAIGSGDDKLITSTYSTKPSLTASTNYILCCVSLNANIYMRYDDGTASQGLYDSSNSYATPTDPTDAGYEARKYTIYCTYSSAVPILTQTQFQFFGTGDELPHYEPAIVPIIESGDITHTNDTSTSDTSKEISYPVYGNGDLIIMAGFSDANVTSHTLPANGPNGETINSIMTGQSPGTNGPRGSVWWYVATAAQASPGTLTLTLASDETCSGECIVVPSGEYYSTTPIGSVSAVGSDNNDSANAIMPAFTPNRSGGRVVCIGGCDADPMANPFSPSGWTDRAGAGRDDGAQNSYVSTRNALSESGVEVASANFDINATDSFVCIGFVVNGTVAVADGRTPLDVAGADPTLSVDTDYGVSVRVENSGGASTEDTYKWEYKLNSGSWTAITSSSSVVKASATGDFANGADVQEYIGGTGTYVTGNNAALDTTGQLVLDAVLGASYSFESHLNFQIVSGDVVDGDKVYLRIVEEDGTALDSYGASDTNIPEITVSEAGAGMVNEIILIFEC